MKREFDEIMKSLKSTINSYDYFVDFQKVFKNVRKNRESLELLSSLLGSKENFDDKFIKLINEHPKSLNAIPSLLAIRANFNVVEILDGKDVVNINFLNKTNVDKDYLVFMEKTGLKDFLANSKIKSLEDYLLGVEVGLDSNARKNRTGKLMEKKVMDYFKKFDDIKIIEQATPEKIIKEFNFYELSKVELKEGKNAKKRFDLAVRSKNYVFLIEINFYNSGGSKLNETARSYEMLAEQIKQIPNCKFIWITDGKGWYSARGNLEESYNHQESLLTLQDLESDLLIDMIRGYSKNNNN